MEGCSGWREGGKGIKGRWREIEEIWERHGNMERPGRRVTDERQKPERVTRHGNRELEESENETNELGCKWVKEEK